MTDLSTLLVYGPSCALEEDDPHSDHSYFGTDQLFFEMRRQIYTPRMHLLSDKLYNGKDILGQHQGSNLATYVFRSVESKL